MVILVFTMLEKFFKPGVSFDGIDFPLPTIFSIIMQNNKDCFLETDHSGDIIKPIYELKGNYLKSMAFIKLRDKEEEKVEELYRRLKKILGKKTEEEKVKNIIRHIIDGKRESKIYYEIKKIIKDIELKSPGSVWLVEKKEKQLIDRLTNPKSSMKINLYGDSQPLREFLTFYEFKEPIELKIGMFL
jgi:hypothetical protein